MQNPPEHRPWKNLLAVAGLLTTLYILAAGPALAFADTHPRCASPVYRFYSPVAWLQYKTPLGGPIEAYVRFWLHIFRKP